MFSGVAGQARLRLGSVGGHRRDRMGLSEEEQGATVARDPIRVGVGVEVGDLQHVLLMRQHPHLEVGARRADWAVIQLETLRKSM